MLRRLTFERCIEGLFLTAVGVAACLMPAQSDTWWHLRAGEETWLAGGVRLHDTFSYTVSGAYWPNQEWLSELLFYGLYRAGGLALLTAVMAAAVVLTWAIVWRLTQGNLRWRVALCVAAAAASAPEWSLRPKVFTLLLVATTASLLARRRYLWLPPMFVLWANLHGGVVLGLAMVCATLLARCAIERRLPKAEAAIVLACLAAASITPLRLTIWAEIPASIARIRQYGIDEWAAPRLSDPVMTPFWLLAAALIAGTVVLRPWRSRDSRKHALLWSALVLLPFALNAGRNAAVLLIAAVPAVSEMIASNIATRRRPEEANRSVLHAVILGTAVAGAALIVGCAWREEIPRLGWHPLEQGAIEALAACPGRLYNRYDDGGYVIWFAPTRKVFIDGRQDPYPPEMMLEHMRVERSGDYGPTFERYSIECAFLPPDSPVAGRLGMDGWTASYADASWVVLSKPASGLPAATVATIVPGPTATVNLARR